MFFFFLFLPTIKEIDFRFGLTSEKERLYENHRPLRAVNSYGCENFMKNKFRNKTIENHRNISDFIEKNDFKKCIHLCRCVVID